MMEPYQTLAVVRETAGKLGLEDFTPISRLGKGSFGEVFLVNGKRDNKLYAMKSISKQSIKSRKLEKYVYAEKSIHAVMKHPFIIPLYCCFQSSHKLFIVIEYMPGGDLGRLLRRENVFTEDIARNYISEIILAIEDLHNHDILYRDLKPENVLIGADGHIKLSDFGLSKQGVSDRDQAQSFCGTVAYLAPEILQKCGHTKSVDWYLVGALLYEMLVGLPPYYSKNRDELFSNIMKSPLHIPKSVSKTAADLIEQLLNRNPYLRLGANGAWEIKNHAFFDSIKWQNVLAKKLEVLKPEINCIDLTAPSLDITEVTGKENEDINYQLKKWTFLAT